MHPILFRLPEWIPYLGGAGLHIYGLMIALGFLIGMRYVKHEAKRVGLDVERILDLFFWVMVAGLAGSRLMYFLTEPSGQIWSNPLVFFKVWQGGLVFQGGIVGAFPVVLYYVKRHKMPFFKVADVFIPPLSLGHGLGRIGCFFAGCCWGGQCPTDFPLALVFPYNGDVTTGLPFEVPLYPTQLGEALGEFLIFGFLLYYRKRKSFDGAVLLIYLMIYSSLRTLIEFFRGDAQRGYVLKPRVPGLAGLENWFQDPYISVGQFMSLMMIVVAAFTWVYLKNKKKTS